MWDSTDTIGSIVEAHANLTEIKPAINICWRVNIPPEKIVMGFGLLRALFSLLRADCVQTLDVYLNGTSSPRHFSDFGGILTYYEIAAILNGANSSSEQSTTITPVHDHATAVKYFKFANV